MRGCCASEIYYFAVLHLEQGIAEKAMELWQIASRGGSLDATKNWFVRGFRQRGV